MQSGHVPNCLARQLTLSTSNLLRSCAGPIKPSGTGATMPPAKSTVTLHGSCHCGRLRIEFSTDQDPADFLPRACDCSFCRKHGAAYVSDPSGRLSVSARGDSLRKYRQGSNTADFLLCGQCGVLVAVAFAHGDRVHAAVNIRCLDGETGFRAPVPASPQALGADEKVSRWLELWIRDVELIEPGG
jgi:hypothetical protein